MGDAQVFIRTATCNCDVREFFDNWLMEVADAQTKEGAFYGCHAACRRR